MKRACACMAAMALVAMSGCKVGPNYQAPQTALPEQFSEATTRPTTLPVELSAWWTVFNDPALDSLIGRAIETNIDLRMAALRVREARALRGITAAGLFPTADASGLYQRSRISSSTAIGALASGGGAATPGGGTGIPKGPGSAAGAIAFPGFEEDLWQGGVDASWELDVFGGVRRALEAADADIAAVLEAHHDVLVILTAEVARNYIELRGFQRQLSIAQENLSAQRQTLDLTQSRFKAGLTGQLDVTRAEAQVASTEATVPIFQTAVKRAMYRLAVLLGQAPETLAAELAPVAAIPNGPPQIPAGLPSELLRRRPDIRRAERQIAAATARIGVATADLYPKFSLTGQFGLQSDSFAKWGNWNSRFWSFGPAVTWSIFTAGRVRSNIDVQNTRTAEAIEQYRQTILLALEDVENALAAHTSEQARRKSLAAAVAANQRSVELATELYTKGLVDFLSVLEAQRSLFASQDQLAQSERAVSADLVAIFKALGGGWGEGEAQAK